MSAPQDPLELRLRLSTSEDTAISTKTDGLLRGKVSQHTAVEQSVTQLVRWQPSRHPKTTKAGR
jgi:hypothetical protein